MKRQRSLKNPPLNFYPLVVRNDESDWMVIHRFHAQQTWMRAKGVRAKGALLAKAILWPLVTIPIAMQKTRKFGHDIKTFTGKSKSRQRVEQLFLAWFQGLSPKSYYLFQLYLPANRRRAQRYIHRYETKGEAVLYRFISPQAQPARRFLNHKDQFHQHCVNNRLPTPPVHMIIKAKPDESQDGEARLPPIDLFVKPALGKGGNFAQIWSHSGDDIYEDTGGQSLRGEELLEKLRRDAADGALLVQSRLKNHSRLNALCGNIFCTARTITVLNENLEPEVTNAVFRMANGSAVVDNLHRGGLAASIDLETGILGSAQSLSPSAMRVDTHPKSKIKISGCRLPHWTEAKDLALRAHRTMPGNALVVIGWDIGFTEEGPVLVEGNSAPGVHALQLGLGAPLGGTRFTELIAFHLARVQSAGQPDSAPASAKAA